MKPRCLQLWSNGRGDIARCRLSASVSLRPVLYRGVLFRACTPSLCTTSPFALYLPSMSRLSFSAAVSHRISRVVFPRGIPTYLHNRDYSSDFPPSICLRRCSRSVRVRSSMSFHPPFSPVTNGGTLVSIELGSSSHCLSQVRCFPFVKTWTSARPGNAPHNALVNVDYDIASCKLSNSMKEINLRGSIR